jgi:hypothetical protein
LGPLSAALTTRLPALLQLLLLPPPTGAIASGLLLLLLLVVAGRQLIEPRCCSDAKAHAMLLQLQLAATAA